MNRYTFSILLTVLLVAAFFLCIILFQREAVSDGDSILIYQNVKVSSPRSEVVSRDSMTDCLCQIQGWSYGG